MQTIAKMCKRDLLQIRKDTQGIINTQVMPAAKEVLKTRTEKAIVIAGKSVTMTIGLANFLRKNVNNGAVLGMCMAMICSGYVPISEGYYDFIKHGVVKNWKWLWGTTTWMDTAADLGRWGIDVGMAGAYGSVSHKALESFLDIIRTVQDTMFYKSGSRRSADAPDLDDAPEIYALLKDIHTTSSGSENETTSGERQRRTNRQRRDENFDMYKRFMEAFGKLPDDVRKAYLLRVFEEGMAKRWAKAERSQPAQLRDAQPQFAIADRSRSRSSDPASSSYRSMISLPPSSQGKLKSLPGGNSAVPGEIAPRVQAAKRANRATKRFWCSCRCVVK